MATTETFRRSAPVSTVLNDLLLYVATFLFGAVFGSFLNVCIYRIPREESIAFPPSHCTVCGHKIKFYNNIPVLSYLLLGGKCADCKSGISAVYPFVEILSGLLLLLTVYTFGLTIKTLFYAVFIYALLVITFIDLKHMIIPNIISLPGIVAGLAFNALITDWQHSRDVIEGATMSLGSFFGLLNEVPFLDSVFGAVLGGGVLLLIAFLYEVIRKREGMGMGDVKLLAMIGAFIGVQGVVFVIFLSSILGTVVGISVILYKRGDFKYALPFGPFLSVASVIYIFTGGFSLQI